MGFATGKLREAVAGQFSSQHAMALRQAVKTNVFDELAQHIDFDVPPSLFQAEYDGIARSVSGEEGHDMTDPTMTMMTMTMITAYMQLMKSWIKTKRQKPIIWPFAACVWVCC